MVFRIALLVLALLGLVSLAWGAYVVITGRGGPRARRGRTTSHRAGSTLICGGIGTLLLAVPLMSINDMLDIPSPLALALFVLSAAVTIGGFVRYGSWGDRGPRAR